ncbi:hypothetical protein Verru16b_00243 [Lacunisphaera limnophila]|uniref:Uncharacterized protein n=1 Tax=Lacunisphaera limnophila TaxID=1838286 RepID=A0A1I7PHV4_9BACT|nr:hypothetical protein [Lacunisphaera limnophila]AOS43200.1 hypothetical protein Verru16b_00243 [Lacunisphaera limnophila]
MFKSTPDPTRSQITASASAAGVPSQNQPDSALPAGNLPFGIAAGLVAALIGAGLWAAITVATEYQIGFMAVGVGFLVGFAVGHFGGGQATVYRVVGATLALLGCVLGNFFTLIGFASQQEQVGFFALLSQIDYTAIPGVMASTASPMDFLFYAIAVYEGFKLSVKS